MKRVLKISLAGVCGIMLLAGCDKCKSCKSGSAGTEDAAESQAGAAVANLDDSNFAEQTATGVVLVDFWAPWCPPCRTQGPIVEKVAGQLGDKAKVVKVDVDKAGESAKAFNVRSIPTLVILKDGKPVKTFTGLTQADTLVAAVKEIL